MVAKLGDVLSKFRDVVAKFGDVIGDSQVRGCGSKVIESSGQVMGRGRQTSSGIWWPRYGLWWPR